MKLEAEYRANLNQVYEEVKKRLVSVPNLLSPFPGNVKVRNPAAKHGFLAESCKSFYKVFYLLSFSSRQGLS